MTNRKVSRVPLWFSLTVITAALVHCIAWAWLIHNSNGGIW